MRPMGPRKERNSQPGPWQDRDSRPRDEGRVSLELPLPLPRTRTVESGPREDTDRGVWIIDLME